MDTSVEMMTVAARELYRLRVGAGAMDFAVEGYQIWEKAAAGQIPHKDLLTRPALEKWLYAHFLKICLPYPRGWKEDLDTSEGHAPLNLTAFIRLVCLLSERGYPSHWLSGILSVLCGGGPDAEITTTARPPVRVFTTSADVDAAFPSMKMTVAPWRAEFTTLLSIWSRLMPFG